SRKTKLHAHAHIHGPSPRTRHRNPRSQPPPYIIQTVAARSMGQHQVASHFEVLGQAAGEFESEVKLIVGRRYGAFELFGAPANIVDVRLQVPFTFWDRFVLVD